MNEELAPFPKGWYTAGGSELWGCNGTYCFIPYEALPPLDMTLFQGTFQWLMDLGEVFEAGLSSEGQESLEANLNRLIDLTAQQGLKLPDPFLRLMASPRLHRRIPSCMCCYFDLSDRLIKSPNGDGSYLIRFLNDSQLVRLWYLYLNQRSEHCIVVATPEFDENYKGETLDDVATPRDLFCCAPTFESFIYRFWVENSIWLAFREDLPLTKAMLDYMNARGKWRVDPAAGRPRGINPFTGLPFT